MVNFYDSRTSIGSRRDAIVFSLNNLHFEFFSNMIFSYF